ncbi:MAG TPA: cytochrome c peroxidase, partial [Polyangiaceae bacterium]|nr:cytochrome c peroxidase [Polyangiaceae bacterium]
AACVLLLLGCKEPDDSEKLYDALKTAAARPPAAPVEEKRGGINPRLLRRFEPLRGQIESSDNPLTLAKVELGRQLFFEKRLSGQQDLSCNSCHDLQHYGVDGQRTSAGAHGRLGSRNSPTVYNAAGFFAEFWDGRAGSVETQAVGPILNPIEMALPNGEYAVRLLKSMPEYVSAFANAFPGEPEPVTFSNVGRAIGAFERKLTTPARWDDYLRGNENALSDRELEGLKIFTNIGCMVCHTGEFVGGSMYQKVGVVEPWPNQKDQGRFETTKLDADRMMFKVPTLRNIAQTAPYFHDGSVPTLSLAVRTMGKHQLGLELADGEIAAIVAWLGSLTGELPQQYVTPPSLPPSSAATPGPLP